MKDIQVKEVSKGDFRCSCGGCMAVEGTVTRKLPLGFGFRGASFVVDSVKQKGYFGQCMECGKSGAWYIGKGKKATSKPKGINAKIKAVQEMN
jgi:hypothetical protein